MSHDIIFFFEEICALLHDLYSLCFQPKRKLIIRAKVGFVWVLCVVVGGGGGEWMRGNRFLGI